MKSSILGPGGEGIIRRGRFLPQHTMTRIQPLSTHILVQVIPMPDQTVGGIILPEGVKANTEPREGIAVAVGRGEYIDGVLVPVEVQAGDRILFDDHYSAGTKVTCDGQEYRIMGESEILAILK